MMSSITNGRRAALALLFIACAAVPAAADWRLTPYTGVQFGGAANTLDIGTLDEKFESRFNVGGSVAWVNGGGFGFEVDYNFTPNLFQLTEYDEPFPMVEINSNVSTFMGSVMFNFPAGGHVSPYIVGGAGLMRATLGIDEILLDLNTNEFAVNFGGGVHVFFNDYLGLRGDARYFRALQNEGERLQDQLLDDEFGLKDYDFWRATFGVTFRFGY